MKITQMNTPMSLDPAKVNSLTKLLFCTQTHVTRSLKFLLSKCGIKKSFRPPHIFLKKVIALFFEKSLRFPFSSKKV